MPHVGVRTRVDSLLAFFNATVRRGPAVVFDNPEDRKKRKHDYDIADDRYPRGHRRPSKPAVNNRKNYKAKERNDDERNNDPLCPLFFVPWAGGEPPL